MANDLRYFYPTKIDMSSAVRPEYQWPAFGYSNDTWYVDPTVMFKQDWLDMMATVGLPVRQILMFYRPAWFQHYHAHIDLHGHDDIEIAALNWVLGGRGSEMRWYDIPEEPFNRSYTGRGIPYIQFPIDNLKEACRSNIGNGLSLVRVDVPHAIFVGDEPRWCISLRGNSKYPSWAEAVEKLQNLNLLQD